MKIPFSFSPSKITYLLGTHAFLCTLVLLFLAFFISAVLFYFSIYLPLKEEVTGENLTSQIQADLFSQIEKEMQERQTQLINVPSLVPRNLFSPVSTH